MGIRTPLIVGALAIFVGCSTSDAPAGAPGTDGGGVGEAHIDSISTMSAAPMSLVTLSGTGFDTKAALWVRFVDAHGYALAVPAVQVSSTRVTAAVPPYFDVASGAIGHAPVDLDVSADPSQSVRGSNTVHGLEISDAASARRPAGFVTSAFLQSAVYLGRQLEIDLAGSTLDTPGMRAALARQIDDLTNLQAQVDTIVMERLL